MLTSLLFLKEIKENDFNLDVLRYLDMFNKLPEYSVVKYSLTTASDVKQYQTKLYNLDAILLIGFRVHSPRGRQFKY